MFEKARRLIVAGCLVGALSLVAAGSAAAYPPGFGNSEAYEFVFQNSAAPQVSSGMPFFYPGFSPEIWRPERPTRRDFYGWGQNGSFPVPFSNPTNPINPLTTPGPQAPTATTPEPSAALIFGAGFLAVGAALRRRVLR